MNNSQSSDVFSSTQDDLCNISVTSNTVPYDSLLSRTKLCLRENSHLYINDATYSKHVDTVLEDCKSCILQGLDFVSEILLSSDIQEDQLIAYLLDAITLLKLLSDYLKSLVELISISSVNFKAFPIKTGFIIHFVFNYCKDSETLFGQYLNLVQKELKELFRNCHELQLTYIMILEKHYTFDLTTNKEELSILVDALEINIHIGEVVQTLDVKTMAEQWKAYTAICEKYVHYLKNSNIFNMTTKLLCNMIANNLKSLDEVSQDDKITQRSVKVTSFLIKIMYKISHIFQDCAVKKYEDIINLLVNIHIENYAYLRIVKKKPEQFIKLVTSHIHCALPSLIEELLLDPRFIKTLQQWIENSFESEEEKLGVLCLLVSIMKISTYKSNNSVPKHEVVSLLFKALPFGYIWFIVGLNFSNPQPNQSPLGLYEYMLVHTTAYVCTFSSTEYNKLREMLYEAVMGTNLWTALFASDLWCLLGRHHNMVEDVVFLCQIHNILENHHLFENSPQHIHLRFTLRRLFESLHEQDKKIVCLNYGIIEEKQLCNISLWAALKIRNVPLEIRNVIKDNVISNVETKIKKLTTQSLHTTKEVDELIETLKLGSTISIQTISSSLEDNLVTSWLKTCSFQVVDHDEIYINTHWFVKLIEALSLITQNIKNVLSPEALIKVLHIVSNISKSNNLELKLLLPKLLCEIAVLPIPYEYNAACNLSQIFRTLLEDNNIFVRNKLISLVRKYRGYKNIENLVEGLTKQPLLEKLFSNDKTTIESSVLMDYFRSVRDTAYVHKCLYQLDMADDIVSLGSKQSSSNFDVADIDNLFTAETVSEPVSKRIKIEDNVGKIIDRLECDILAISRIKENLTHEHKLRLRGLCDTVSRLSKNF